MGLGSETPEFAAQTEVQESPSEGKPQLSQSPHEEWNLGVLESGPDGEGEAENNWAAAMSPMVSLKDETSTYPEGGVRAWLVVFGSWCGIFVSLGTASSFGSFQTYFIQHQLSSYSPAAVGWIFSLYAFLAFACGIFVGPIFDTYGPTWLILGGSIGVCSAMLLIGLCTQYWQFLVVFGLLGGGGSCLLYTPSVAAIGHYFKKHRGNALGIGISSSAIGGVTIPLLLEHLTPRMGFAWSTRLIGLIYVCACVIACMLVRSRLPRTKNATAMPNFGILREPAFAITVLAVYLLQWGYFGPVAYISSYALYHGFSSAFASNALVFLNLGSIFGRWLPGFTGDRIGHYNSIIIMTMVIVASVFGIWLPLGQTKAGLVVFTLIFGFGTGSILTLTAACIGQLCQTKNYGLYYATAYTVASVGFLTGIPIGGELLVLHHGDYVGLIIFVGICYGGALAALVVVRCLKTGRRIMVVY